MVSGVSTDLSLLGYRHERFVGLISQYRAPLTSALTVAEFIVATKFEFGCKVDNLRLSASPKDLEALEAAA